MQDVQDSFELRVREVDAYFRFLALTQREDSEIYLPHRASWRRHPIDSATQKVLKANALLVLYNLMEAAVRSGLQGVYEAIADSGEDYATVNSTIQKLWIYSRTKRLTAGNTSIDKIRATAQEIADDILAAVRLEFERDFIPLAGNIDARRVRKIAARVGFSSRVISAANAGQSLKIVKDKRNDLAHGIVSFAECGREFTMQDLDEIKREVVIYLRNILRNMRRFVDARRYAG